MNVKEKLNDMDQKTIKMQDEIEDIRKYTQVMNKTLAKRKQTIQELQ